MLFSWWKRNVALNTFAYTSFILGLASTITGTYVTYQLQHIGFLIGTDLDGGSCLTYCIVPWGGKRLDLNSVLLYLSAMQTGLGGFVAIFVVAYADFWKHKSLLLPIFMVVYGALGIPSYWLTAPTLANFNTLFAIFVVYGVITVIFMALLNVYIPHYMRSANESVSASPSMQRKMGFVISSIGMVFSNISGVIMLGVIALLSAYLPTAEQQSAGLLVTTIVGFITVVAALGSYLGLPTLPARAPPADDGPLWKSAVLELLTPFRKLLHAPNMLILLLAYTIYTDTQFALISIINQLFFVTLAPNTLEYTLFTLAGQAFVIIATLALVWVQRVWGKKLNLERCLLVGYAMLLVVPVWCCIGMSHQNAFGNKHRWEFYVQQLLMNTSSAIVNVVFRILYAEFIPAGEEVMWYGLQIVVSCATTWVTYVATGPLQNATHDLRFPVVLCLVFLAFPVALEVVRVTVPRFRKAEKSEVLEDAQKTKTSEESTCNYY
ncbi:Autophagy-related protein [Mycena indigotica]|uniref:Autophagy-related protein n=1 Tax=Mycena indigotica TaxID=2126181 RepID=A0A8H6WEK8_9AGAR|nr:Autophagy-related protein [Mycena indigotica]KAF7311958.1 Autophagy-related protein [Mycena indigotica]